MFMPRASTALVLVATLAVVSALTAPSAAQVLHNGCEAEQTLLDETTYEDLDHMGQSIAIGDFNHDGIQDIVMGGYNRLPSGEGDYQQAVCVFLGTDTGPRRPCPAFGTASRSGPPKTWTCWGSRWRSSAT